MTQDEALKVARIALTADHGCSYCGPELIERLMAALPEVDWRAIVAQVEPDSERWALEPFHGDWADPWG